jgi:hypothetical protein
MNKINLFLYFFIKNFQIISYLLRKKHAYTYDFYKLEILNLVLKLDAFNLNVFCCFFVNMDINLYLIIFAYNNNNKDN